MAVALPVLSRRVVSCSVAQVVCSLFSSRIVSSPAWSGDAQRFALAFGFFCWVSSGAPHVPVLALGALCSQRTNKKQKLSKAVFGRSVVSAGLLAPHRLARSDRSASLQSSLRAGTRGVVVQMPKTPVSLYLSIFIFSVTFAIFARHQATTR